MENTVILSKTERVLSDRKYEANLSTAFFDEQLDLVPLILGFLDVKSLLVVCRTAKVFSLCLRHGHVIASAWSELPRSPLSPEFFSKDTNGSNQTLNHNEHTHIHLISNEDTIIKKLLQVYEKHGIQFTSIDLSNGVIGKISKPSPIRLLRLVNGRKCEHCYRRLFPRSGNENNPIILPSLSFGRYCCTTCMFKE